MGIHQAIIFDFNSHKYYTLFMRYLIISLLLSGCAVDPVVVSRIIMNLPYNDPFFVSQKFGKDLHGDPEIKVRLDNARRETLK